MEQNNFDEKPPKNIQIRKVSTKINQLTSQLRLLKESTVPEAGLIEKAVPLSPRIGDHENWAG